MRCDRLEIFQSVRSGFVAGHGVVHIFPPRMSLTILKAAAANPTVAITAQKSGTLRSKSTAAAKHGATMKTHVGVVPLVNGSTRGRRMAATSRPPCAPRHSPADPTVRAIAQVVFERRRRRRATHPHGQDLAATPTRPSIVRHRAIRAVARRPRRRLHVPAIRRRYRVFRLREPVSEARGPSAG
jgi:hypothetical protein